MKKRDKPYEEIYDLLAIRVLVEHGARVLPRARHHPRRVDAAAGAHQGLHRAARSRTATSRCTRRSSGRGSQLFEIQIRTREMHRTAEFGIAAHWLYKEDAQGAGRARSRTCTGSARCSSCSSTPKTPDEFLEFLKLDLYQDEIFVFTPTGDVDAAAARARRRSTSRSRCTPRSACTRQGAKVNGRIAPLSRELQELGDGRDHHVDARAAEPRLARPRPHGPRAPQDPAVAASTRSSRPSAAKLGQEILDREVKRRRLAKPDDDAARTRPPTALEPDATRRTCSRRSGRAT